MRIYIILILNLAPEKNTENHYLTAEFLLKQIILWFCKAMWKEF